MRYIGDVASVVNCSMAFHRLVTWLTSCYWLLHPLTTVMKGVYDWCPTGQIAYESRYVGCDPHQPTTRQIATSSNANIMSLHAMRCP